MTNEYNLSNTELTAILMDSDNNVWGKSQRIGKVNDFKYAGSTFVKLISGYVF